MTPCPRISFAFELDPPMQEKPTSPLNSSSSDFVFIIPSNQRTQEFSLADELFSNGFILPLSSLSRGRMTAAEKTSMENSFKPFCRRSAKNKRTSKNYYYGCYQDSGAVCVSPVLNFSPTCAIVSFYEVWKLLSSRFKFKGRKKKEKTFRKV